MAGKAAVSGNARRHGLSVPMVFDDLMPDRYEALARALEGADPARRQLAREAAQVRFNLDRILTARSWLMQERTEELRAEGCDSDDPAVEARMFRDIVDDLRKLGDLARRQRSRWRKVMKALDDVG